MYFVIVCGFQRNLRKSAVLILSVFLRLILLTSCITGNWVRDLTFLSFSSTCARRPGRQVWVIAKWSPSCLALSPVLRVSLSAYRLPEWPPVAISIQTQLKRLLQLESRQSTCVIYKRMMTLVSFNWLASPSRPEHCALGCKLIISRRLYSRHCFILPTCWSCCRDDSPELQTVSECDKMAGVVYCLVTVVLIA